jgi:hypothetical protein
MQKRLDKCVRSNANEFNNHTNDSDWETVAQLCTIARLWSHFKAYSGKRSWEVISNRLQRSRYLSCVISVRTIKDRKLRMYIGKYSLVNRHNNKRSQLNEEELGTFHCKHSLFGRRVWKAITRGEMKRIELWRISSQSAVK